MGLVLQHVHSRKGDIAFALAACMAGPRRRQLQEWFVANGALPLLASLLGEVDWLLTPGRNSPAQRIHGPTCECR